MDALIAVSNSAAGGSASPTTRDGTPAGFAGTPAIIVAQITQKVTPQNDSV